MRSLAALPLLALCAACSSDPASEAAGVSDAGEAGTQPFEDASLDAGDGGTAGDVSAPEDAGDGAPTADAGSLPACPCFAGDGLYCGAAIAQYGGAHHCGAPGLASHGGDVYRCTAGAWTVATMCGAAGCYVAANGPDGCHVAGATKNIWVVFHPSASPRDLAGLFQCLLSRTDFNDRARSYPNGYGLRWGGQTTAACAASDYACGVAALARAGMTVGDHDVVELVQPGYCGGDNDAHADGVVVGNIRVRGANVGDCTADLASQERVAVHEAFESVGDWANADCCTGEVDPAHCADNGEAFCPSCPCTCGRYRTDGTYGAYTLDCGGGKTYTSQRVPSSVAGEFDPNACTGFTMVQ